MTRLLAHIPAWVYPLLVLGALLAWELTPREHAPINPDALQVVRAIVDLCMEPGVQGPGTESCDDVRYVVEWCTTRGRGHCTANQVYETMATLGFKLPPLHLQRP